MKQPAARASLAIGIAAFFCGITVAHPGPRAAAVGDVTQSDAVKKYPDAPWSAFAMPVAEAEQRSSQADVRFAKPAPPPRHRHDSVAPASAPSAQSPIVPRLLPLSAPSAHRISRALLSRLASTCANTVDAVTQLAIVQVESGGDAWALHDDNDGRVYHPPSFQDAQRLTGSLLAEGSRDYGAADRGLDVGLGQINSSNFSTLGVQASDMLDPCKNLHASATIIGDAYRRERSRGGDSSDEQLALRRALSVYNSGHPTGDDNYVAKILAAAITLAPAASADAASADAQKDISFAEPRRVESPRPSRFRSRSASKAPVSGRFAHASTARGAASDFLQ